MSDEEYDPNQDAEAHLHASVHSMARHTTANSLQGMRHAMEGACESILAAHFRISEAIEELRHQAEYLRGEMYQFDDWGYGGIDEHAKLLVAERLIAAYDGFCETIEDEIEKLSDEKLLAKWDGERWW